MSLGGGRPSDLVNHSSVCPQRRHGSFSGSERSVRKYRWAGLREAELPLGHDEREANARIGIECRPGRFEVLAQCAARSSRLSRDRPITGAASTCSVALACWTALAEGCLAAVGR